MFKEIIAISKNYAMVRIEGTSNEDLLNMNLIFEDPIFDNFAKKYLSRPYKV